MIITLMFSYLLLSLILNQQIQMVRYIIFIISTMIYPQYPFLSITEIYY
jgi:hypothetical protein